MPRADYGSVRRPRLAVKEDTHSTEAHLNAMQAAASAAYFASGWQQSPLAGHGTPRAVLSRSTVPALSAARRWTHVLQECGGLVHRRLHHLAPGVSWWRRRPRRCAPAGDGTQLAARRARSSKATEAWRVPHKALPAPEYCWSVTSRGPTPLFAGRRATCTALRRLDCAAVSRVCLSAGRTRPNEQSCTFLTVQQFAQCISIPVHSGVSHSDQICHVEENSVV